MFNLFGFGNGVKWEEVMSDNESRILDVREKYEWDAGHYNKAEHLPLGSLAKYKDDGRKVYVYCASGIRSARAVSDLKRKGVNAVNVKGGYSAYEKLKRNK